MQSKKNLAEWCKSRADEERSLSVRIGDEIEVWRQRQLLECARDAYEEIFMIEPKFYHKEIYLSLAEVYQKLGREEDGRRFYNEVLRKSQWGVGE